MSTEDELVEQLKKLALHLEERREAILQAWEKAVEEDPQLKTASSLSFSHFRDLMPKVLENFEDRLKSTGLDESALGAEERDRVIDHGLHRWQQGFSLHELILEWKHLQLAVQAELDRYALTHPRLQPEFMITARRLWARLCGEGIAESVAQYARLQQVEADGHLRDLQEALERLKDLERQRAESWREAAHDLRGNVGLISTTTSILADDEMPEPLRAKAFGMLQSSVSSLHQLLEDLMSLARLEAGHERRVVEPFDASVLLRTLCDGLQPLAQQRGLFLVTEGPATLPVEGDPAKVQRIVLNLALNALRYTGQGRVTVCWSETRESDIERWLIRIQDTGPGLHFGPGAPIARELEEATDLGRNVEEENPDDVEPIPGSSSASPLPAGPQRPGEGIGLSIVKRLCELLEAGLEVATEAGKGTTFQVSLPRRYPK